MKPKRKTDRPPRWRIRLAPGLRALLGFAGAGGFLLLLFAASSAARAYLAGHPRYSFPFSRIECAVPDGVRPAAFLDEVQYLAGRPNHLDLLEPDLPRRLAEAFAQHPRVRAVRSVRVSSPGRVAVELEWRVPVLRVIARDEREGAESVREVDRDGVLLPPGGNAAGLPLLANPVALPEIPSGQVWDDPLVLGALRELERLSRGGETATRIERTAAGWRIDGRLR
ncbi:MAG TPA: hypothetical protein VIL46_16905 [Gemmataceae bacterium]